MPNNSPKSLSSQSPKYIKLISTLIAIAISALIFIFKDKIASFEQHGYIGIFLVSVIGNATLFLPAPVLITVAAMGAALNPFAVGLVSSFGAAIGESVGYVVGLGGNILIEKNQKYQNTKRTIDKHGPWGIFVLAALPNPLFDLAGIMAGALGITYPQFFLATWGGACIKYTLTSLFGSGIGSLF